MLRYLLLGLILIHGLIHLLGFVKAFHLTEVNQLTSPIGKGTGVLWLLTTLLLLAAAGALLLGQGAWSALALLGVLLSQILIFTAWSDAKFGTLANVILLVVAIAVSMRKSLGLTAGDFTRVIGYTAQVAAAFINAAACLDAVVSYSRAWHVYDEARRK